LVQERGYNFFLSIADDDKTGNADIVTSLNGKPGRNINGAGNRFDSGAKRDCQCPGATPNPIF
jgi:hypothetical protein